jgi:hypothetical protein
VTPTQLQVDAMAELRFGIDWKVTLQREQRRIDGVIADRLDEARAAVIEEAA